MHGHTNISPTADIYCDVINFRYHDVSSGTILVPDSRSNPIIK